MLFGKSVRNSPAVDQEEYVWHDGYVKVRLGHSKKGTVIVPDMIFAKSGTWRYFHPSFFGPCILGFDVEPGRHVARFDADVCSPRSTETTRLMVEIYSSTHILAYPDGAQLYACQLKGPKHLAPFSSGRCQRLTNNDFAVRLFHHTNRKAYSSIRASQELWSSSWNLRGIRNLKNVNYVNLTSLPKIERLDDLHRIAMASNGVLRLKTTSNRPVQDVLELPVYRESTTGRTHSIVVDVPSRLLAPDHLFFHNLVASGPAYYEVVGPEIFRIGLLPGGKLPIPRGIASLDEEFIKSFDYVVKGDTSTVGGLGSPYDEESTDQVMHLEKLDKGIDLFEYWQKNANSDQMLRPFHEVRELDTL